ncbi:MAG: hypothetical protein HY537_01495 [Deltaproteobacteria bacterium]|nr:hypothetical protein [Deltaproteobacteria bacterium]
MKIVSFLVFVTLVVPALGTPKFGRYVGFLKHDSLAREQLAKIDFIVSRSSSNELELKAVLTLHFGGFNSGEYVDHHYDNVRYNLLSNTLVFDDAEQSLSIFVTQFTDGVLKGDVKSIWTGAVGQITLYSDRTPIPAHPIVERLWGEYEGHCGDEKSKLQIYTYRTTEDAAHQAESFAAYSIKAQMPTRCVDGLCTVFRYTNGSYNFFLPKEQLTLVGTVNTLICSVSDTLECTVEENASKAGHCSFKSVTRETEQFVPTQFPSPFPTNPKGSVEEKAISSLKSGEYRGYVFHESLNQYQRASMNLTIFQYGSGSEGGTRISAHSKLYFGDFDSREVIPYRFSEKLYPNPIVGPQNLVFSRLEANVDAILQVTEIKDNIIRGIWYSILFGRVGPFELRQNEPPKIDDTAVVMGTLSGVYNNPDWTLYLRVVPGIKPVATSENPFFPNFVRGSMIMNNGVTPMLPITDGSYDFYTGRIGFTKPTSLGIEHGWVGSRTSNNELRLFHAPLGPIANPKHKPQLFMRKGD